MSKKVIQVEEKVPIQEAIPLSIQHLFAMFGASVLVPALFHINPAIVLLFNGIGTIIYFFLTKGKIPAFLGSSFAFLSPVFVVMSVYDYRAALGGFVVSGLLFITVSIIIRYTGTGWISVVFPPAAMGSIVAVIGLELIHNAALNAGIIVDKPGQAINPTVVLVSMLTLAVVIFSSVLLRGFLSAIPILIGIIFGCILSWKVGLLNTSLIISAKMFAVPQFTFPSFKLGAIITILPATFVIIAEHIGHLIVTGNIVGKDLTKDPGLHRSMLGDGVSTALSGFFGSVPTTTYGENIGVMAVTKVYSARVIAGAGVLSAVLAFSGKLAAAIQSIPVPVMGGVSMLLFGIIAASGIRMLVEEKVDYSKSRNLTLTSVVLGLGLSGAAVKMGSISLTGMGLATVASIILSLLFFIFDKVKLMNDTEPDAE